MEIKSNKHNKWLNPHGSRTNDLISVVYSNVTAYRGRVPLTKKDQKVAQKAEEDHAYVCSRIRQRRDLFSGVHIEEVQLTGEYVHLLSMNVGVGRVKSNFLEDWKIDYSKFIRTASNGVASGFYLPAQ